MLRVRDLRTSRDTYAGKLKLPERAIGVNPNGRPACALTVGHSLLELHQDPMAQPVRNPVTGVPLTSMDDNRCWVGHFALPVVDAIALHREMAERGIPWTCEPSDQPAGLHLTRRRLLEFTDPDYLTVQFAERIDEEGVPILPADIDFRDQPWPGCDRFDHFMFNTPNMDAKRAFYIETLGLSAGPIDQTRIGLQCDLEVAFR
jgi:catechol 2,3-dioxygenase-like lactoylglutathione lyase family enzyme